jgi:hypothetical protein
VANAESEEKKYGMLFENFPVWSQLRDRALAELKTSTLDAVKQLEKADRTIGYYLQQLWKDNNLAQNLLSKGWILDGKVYKALEQDKSPQGTLLFNSIKVFGPAMQIINPQIKKLQLLVEKQANLVDVAEMLKIEEEINAALRELSTVVHTDLYNQFIGFTKSQAAGSKELKYAVAEQDKFWVVVKIISVLHIYWESIGKEVGKDGMTRRKFLQLAGAGAAGAAMFGIGTLGVGAQALENIEGALKKEAEKLPHNGNLAILITTPRSVLEKLGNNFIGIYIARMELLFETRAIVYPDARKEDFRKVLKNARIEHITLLAHGDKGGAALNGVDRPDLLDWTSFLVDDEPKSKVSIRDIWRIEFIQKRGYFLKHTCGKNPWMEKPLQYTRTELLSKARMRSDQILAHPKLIAAMNKIVEKKSEKDIFGPLPEMLRLLKAIDAGDKEALKLIPKDISLQELRLGAAALIMDYERQHGKLWPRREMIDAKYNDMTVMIEKMESEPGVKEFMQLVDEYDKLTWEFIPLLLGWPSFPEGHVAYWNVVTDPLDFLMTPANGTDLKDEFFLSEEGRAFMKWIEPLHRKIAEKTNPRF